MQQFSSLFLVSAILAFAVGGSWGWGKQGHMMIAQIAADRLNNAASGLVSQFIGSDTLAQIAPLPDDFDHSPDGRWSSSCHYCNLPRDATSFLMRYCPNFCVVKSIQNYTQILSSEESNPFQCNFQEGVEPCALEFLVHYVGDVHQPLHVGYGDDEGGNSVQVDFYGERANLHKVSRNHRLSDHRKVWDDLIIEKWNSDFNSATQALETMIANNPNTVNQYLSVTDPILWANESFGYVLSTVYDFNPSGNHVFDHRGDARLREPPHLGDAYYNANLPIIQQRLIAAGVRLGALLNQIL